MEKRWAEWVAFPVVEWFPVHEAEGYILNKGGKVKLNRKSFS